MLRNTCQCLHVVRVLVGELIMQVLNRNRLLVGFDGLNDIIHLAADRLFVAIISNPHTMVVVIGFVYHRQVWG